MVVSTHSRPKAAGSLYGDLCVADFMFQHTAARRRLAIQKAEQAQRQAVSTHSRPKAAGQYVTDGKGRLIVSTHSRPKAAGKGYSDGANKGYVSTHSRPKAAGNIKELLIYLLMFQHTAARRRLGVVSAPLQCLVTRFQHTAARRRLGARTTLSYIYFLFQHTAARRRLACRHRLQPDKDRVSTHSRPKAAGTSGL